MHNFCNKPLKKQAELFSFFYFSGFFVTYVPAQAAALILAYTDTNDS